MTTIALVSVTLIIVLAAATPCAVSTESSSAPPFGHQLLPLFQMRRTYLNLNHGSYGSTPKVVIDNLRYWQDQMELNTDDWFRYRMWDHFDDERAAVASYVKANASDIVFVPNASHGVNSVLRSLFPPSRTRNKVLYLSTAYGMVKNVLKYLTSQSILHEDTVMVNVSFPYNKQQLLNDVEAAINKHDGEIYLASFSHITSIPALILPITELARLCHSANILVSIDGAHALGQIPLDIPSYGVDIYITNAHKWFYTPKGTAILWVHPSIQPLIWPTTISGEASLSSQFLSQFAYEGTLDYSGYLTFSTALAFRAQFGETSLMNYMHNLAVTGGTILSKRWNTDWLVGAEYIASMVNVRLPTDGSTVDPLSIMKTLLDRFNTWVPVYQQDSRWYVRVSAQIYNEESDFVYLAESIMTILHPSRSTTSTITSHDHTTTCVATS